MDVLVAAAIEEEASMPMMMEALASAAAAAPSIPHPYDHDNHDDEQPHGNDDDNAHHARAAQDPVVEEYQLPPAHNYGNHPHHHNSLDDYHPPTPNDTARPNGVVVVVGADTVENATRVAVSNGITWQAMFQQLKDFHDLGHRRGFPPRMTQWMAAQRRRYKMYGIGITKPTGIITHRIRQLNSIGFEWTVMMNHESGDESWSQSHHRQVMVVNKKGCSPVHPRIILPRDYDPDDEMRYYEGSTPVPPNKRKKKNQLVDDNTDYHADAAVMSYHSYESGGWGKKWTPAEDDLIDRLQILWGNKWASIARELNNGRTDNDVKNRWNSKRRSRERKEAEESRYGVRYAATMDDDGGVGAVTHSTEMDYESHQEEESEPEDEEDRGRRRKRQRNTSSNGKNVRDLVRAALERDRRKEMGIVDDDELAFSNSSGRGGRSRKPSRRVQDSYVGGKSDRRDGSRDSPRRLEEIERGRKKRLFPELLFAMVDECSESNPDFIEWTPDGTAFCIKRLKLMPGMLQRYFRHNKYSSLQRMLHLYGFKKPKQHQGEEYDGICWKHTHFYRDTTRDNLIARVTKVSGENSIGGGGGEPSASSALYEQGKKIHAEKKKEAPRSKRAKRAKHPKPGQGDGGDVPRHALLSNNAKAQQEKGVAHPSLLFQLPLPPQPTVTKIELNAATEEEIRPRMTKETMPQTQLTPNDVCFSLTNPKYQRVMYSQFKRLGDKKKTKEGQGHDEDCDSLRIAVPAVFQTLQRIIAEGSSSDSGGGRFLKKVRGGNGVVWYEVVDDSWAMQKISNDLRRRMESAKYWLDDGGESGEQLTIQQELPTNDEANESQKAASDDNAMATQRKDDNRSEPESDGDDPMPTKIDLVVSLTTPKYRDVMFAQFKKLGEKTDTGEDVDHLKAIGKELFSSFKGGMVTRGRFFQKARGAVNGEAPYKLLDDAMASRKMTHDLRSRMELVNDWRNFTPKSDVAETKRVEEPDIAALKPEEARSSSKLSLSEEPELLETLKPLPSLNLNWNLGSYASMSGVQYFKSDIDKNWVEQRVPRRTLKPRGPTCDKYFMAPDGKRFRSMAEVQRFLNKESGLMLNQSTDDDDDEEEEEDSEGEKEDMDEDASGTVHDSEEEEGNKSESVGCENFDPAQPKDQARKHRQCKGEEAESISEDDGSVEEEYDEDTYTRDSEKRIGDVEAQEKNTMGPKSSFVETLHDLVSFVAANDPSVISWMAGGKAFTVHDMSKENLGPYLEKFFRHNNYSSLLRQLNNYGFSRHITGRFAGAFHHPGFHRNMKSKAEFSSISRVGSATEESNESCITIPADSNHTAWRPRKLYAPTPQSTSRQDANDIEVESEGGKPVVYQPPVHMQCPTCLKNFTFSKKTAAASFANHVRVCDPEKRLKASKTKEPRKKAGKSIKGRPRKIGSSSKVDGSAEKRKSEAVAKDEPMSFHCAKCGKDFHFNSKKTASASFWNHVRKCDPERYEARKAKKAQNSAPKKKHLAKGQGQEKPRRNSLPQKTLLKKVDHGNSAPKSLPPPKKEQIGLEKPTPIKLTMNLTPKPDQNAPKKPATTPTQQKSALEKPTSNEPATKPVLKIVLKKRLSSILTNQGHVPKMPSPQPMTKPTIASVSEPTTPKPSPVQSSTSAGKPHDDDIILSLKNPRYKRIMFAKFQTMGARKGGGENSRLDQMKHDLFSFFKEDMGDDGRFLKSDRHMNDTWVVDDSDALEKIKMDLKRRNESSKHWLKE